MIQQNENLRNRSGLDLVEFDHVEDNSKLNQESIENIVRNVITNNSGIFVQDKERMTEVCSFATALSNMVQSKLETSNKKRSNARRR